MTCRILLLTLALALLPLGATAHDRKDDHRGPDRHDDHRRGDDVRHTPHDLKQTHDALHLLHRGRKIFRYDTFGDEVFWGDALRLHEAIAGAANGGVGPGVSPATALSLGLKVDVEALPHRLRNDIRRGRVDLDDPATTLALLKLDAVVGVRGFFTGNRLTSVGITCALCHSTVDDAFAPGIGRRLDGWAAGDLNVGAIIAAAPNLQPLVDQLSLAIPGIDEATVRTVLQTWGPGKFDASLLMDGKAFTPDGRPAATLIPSIFGLAGVNLHTWTGWGSVTHWNAFVANLEMGGQGVFIDERLRDPARFPIAAAAGLYEVRHDPDLVTSKLAPLHFYQLALRAPKPPRSLVDEQAAARGKELFNGQAQCASCHVPPIYTEPGWNLHTADQIGIDDFQAERSPEARYRTSPLAGLWTRGDRGYYHDGRFATLLDVIDHYDAHFSLGLTDQQKRDLVSFLQSL
ncbi:MAG TPA: hypothetical protein VF210_16970 [Pseudomonadales bacterium]